eukprot:354239-Chlamydomonas_euryale.AAC.9
MPRARPVRKRLCSRRRARAAAEPRSRLRTRRWLPRAGGGAAVSELGATPRTREEHQVHASLMRGGRRRVIRGPQLRRTPSTPSQRGIQFCVPTLLSGAFRTYHRPETGKAPCRRETLRDAARTPTLTSTLNCSLHPRSPATAAPPSAISPRVLESD